VPYIENPFTETLETVKKIMDSYFSVVDTVRDFDITGGEPLLHKDLPQILIHALNYQDQFEHLLILTNGTLLFKDDALTLLAENSGKIRVSISHYGEISHNAEKLQKSLNDRNIPFRLIKYHGKDVFCGGWVDYNDHTLKHITQEEIDEQAQHCAFRKDHGAFTMINGELHSCGRSHWRMELGIIPRNPLEVVDLLDDSISNEEKRKRIMGIYNAKSTTACAYCNGLRSDSKRYPPAEQLTSETKQPEALWTQED
jgi:hypothetical protein